jgi:hypothetical protein
MSQETMIATAQHYFQQWTWYLLEQYMGNQVEQLPATTWQWLDGAVTQRMARMGSDRRHVLHRIERELRGETPDQHRWVMIPDPPGDKTGRYALVIEDWVQVYINERRQLVWSIVQEPPPVQQP